MNIYAHELNPATSEAVSIAFTSYAKIVNSYLQITRRRFFRAPLFEFYFILFYLQPECSSNGSRKSNVRMQLPQTLGRERVFLIGRTEPVVGNFLRRA
jgi:hypothetical protein